MDFQQLRLSGKWNLSKLISFDFEQFKKTIEPIFQSGS
jgi:hypothetical protein